VAAVPGPLIAMALLQRKSRQKPAGRRSDRLSHGRLMAIGMAVLAIADVAYAGTSDGSRRDRTPPNLQPDACRSQ